MILSVSRRTDIPAWYADWFFNRLREGYVLVRNPMNFHQISKVSLRPEAVDGMVFWTKNPIPMLDRLDLLREYACYFQFTVTGYGEDAEPGLPSKSREIIPAFERLAQDLGPHRVIWRYDPIFISPAYSAEYHVRCFEKMAKILAPCTCRCTISFLDFYEKMKRNCRALGIAELSQQQQRELAGQLGEIARSYGLEMDTCAEELDLSEYGIGHARCVDTALFARLLGAPLQIGKDKNQRAACGCAESIDIGAYDTCGNGCRYCYANHSSRAVYANFEKHDPASSLLIGHVGPEDVVSERRAVSGRMDQLRFF